MLVARGLARSRDRARELIRSGAVTVDGTTSGKPSARIREDSEIVVDDPRAHYVGRAAGKLEGALNSFPRVMVRGARVLDAGASTGGFTQVLLERGARQVVAVDVGRGQLADVVAADPRVVEYSGTDIRAVLPDDVGGPFDLIVADLSFISLRLVLPALAALTSPSGQVIALVKPQFEAGREALDSRGVVRNPALRAAAVADVVQAAEAVGLRCRGVAASEVPGAAGNAEFFLLLDSLAEVGLGLSEVRDAVLLNQPGLEGRG